jgi:hypothetical protein
MNEVQRENAQILRRDRSYFGVLRVLIDDGEELSTKEAEILSRNAKAAGEKDDVIQAGMIPPYTYLMHGTTHHGLNYQAPQGLRRLATTYYHRKGPVGVIFERFNWFPDPESNITFWADVRLPASIVAMAANPLPLGGPLPTEVFGTYFSEPPYATIGLGTGTMASYGRPFQHVSFYEIDNHIRSFSMEEWHWPNTDAMKKKYPNLAGIHAPYFNYLHDALARGANLEIIMGDARMSMRPDIEEMRENERQEKQLWAERAISNYQIRQNYYHAIVVDAFSSDAIPVHLITEEAIQQYFQKLAEEGVLCVHTSNRHVDLVSPVSDIAAKLKLAYVVGNDLGQGQTLVNRKGERAFIGTGDRGHFQSEYVMVARKMEYLPPPTSPADMAKFENREEGAPPLRWTVPPPPGSRVWTDDYSNMMSVFRWGFH